MSTKKKWIIGGSIAAGVILVGSVGSALGLGNKDGAPTSDMKPTTSAEPATEAEPAPTIVVPDVVGIPVSDAIAVLTDAGLIPPALSTFEDPTALVVSTSRAAGSTANDGAAISIVVEEKPKLTLGQQNAIDKAQSYLSFAGFSRSGLIEQLEFEGFSTEDSTFGADNAGADWNAECAEKAQSYMDMSSFSRQGLYDQLAFEGFQAAEIEFGLAAVGY
ncbi:Ltp family lipoprotein [Microbacterium sp. PI-1]|uniref:Ltp family lipoprotein n=1 Tax=Microbacterium sp. PI-1 TaxID=2545631 RepID=UPI001F117715|nr:Ltp family lipoprotein [Microbacterium sp. PI-1]